VPDKPLAVKVPDVCPHCGRAGVVRLQQELTGASIQLEWHCIGCQAEWPVKRKEQEPGFTP
jgi:hypothetical protein